MSAPDGSAEEPGGGASGRGNLHCPSAPAAPGGQLIGVVQQDGRVALLGKALPLDDDFLDKVRRGRAPEKRFRFSAPCLKDGCKQWSDGQCGVIRRVLSAVEDDAALQAEAAGTDSAPLQPCALRGACRWFAERGRPACRVCPLVVTDTRGG